MAKLKEREEQPGKKGGAFFARIVDGISGVFMPLVNLMSAAGIMKGLLTLLVSCGVLREDESSYLVLNAMADSLFYFLPMFLAYTAAQKFGANPFTAMTIGGVLVFPALTEAFEKGSVYLFGLEIIPVKYPYSVIPALLAVGLLVWLERLFNRILPELVKGFLTPFLCVALVGGVSLFVLVPIGKVIGDWLAVGYQSVYQFSPVAAGICLSGVVQLMVMFGFHWSLVPIAINNISVMGYDTVMTFFAPPVFAQTGAALAVFVKSHDKAFKTTALSAAVTASFGVTEPAMFGVNLPRRKPMLAVCLSGAVGGAIVGCSGATAAAFAFPGIPTMPIFIGPGFGVLLLACLVSLILSFVMTMLMRFEVDLPGQSKQEKEKQPAVEGAGTQVPPVETE